MDRSIITHVEGDERGNIMLFALSTCMWCRKTRELLEDLGVAYDYIYVDLVERGDRDEVDEEIKRWNPGMTFPIVVINDDRTVIGYRPDEIKDELTKLGQRL